MNRICKIVLIWLLIAALPLQGVAAAVKLSCGSPSPGFFFTDAQLAQHSEFSSSQAYQAHSAAMHSETMHSHGVSPSAHETDLSYCASKTGHCDEPHQHKDGNCSTCAACCFGTIALPYSILSADSRSGSAIVTVSPPSLAGNHIPSGLERPPRNIFA